MFYARIKERNLNFKENRRNSLPGPRGPVVSLDMLRSVKLKSARRRSEQIMRSPRSARMIDQNPNSVEPQFVSYYDGNGECVGTNSETGGR